MKTYWIVLPDCTSFKRHRAIFIKRRAPKNPVPQDRVLETRAPAKFCVLYGYSLWYDAIFVDNINVLDLALWAEKILKLNDFLCSLKQKKTQLSQKDRSRFVSLNILLSGSRSL